MSTQTSTPHQATKSSIIGALSLIVLMLPAIQPLLTTDFTCGYDNGFHLWRAVQVAENLRRGYFSPRWMPDMAHGYGFPLFIFQSPLTAYIAATMNLLGIPWPLAINGTFALGMLLSGCLTFILVRDLFGPSAGLVAAVAYVFAPFQAYDVFYRGSLSESFAWAFPPLILWAVHHWSIGSKGRFLLLGALGLAGFVLTHTLFAFLFAPLLAGWVLMTAYLTHDKHVIIRGALAGLLGLGLCTFFWLPGLAERRWVQIDRLLGTWVFDYRYNFIELGQLLAPPRTADSSLINDWPPKALGLMPMIVALLTLFGWRRMDRAMRWTVALLLTFAIGSAFLTLPASQPIWDRVPLLSYVQFPWRFLGPAAFCIALLAGISVAALQPPARDHPSPLIPNSHILLPMLLCPILVLSNLGWFYPRHCPPPQDISIAGMIAWEQTTDTLGTTAKGEYLPIWVHRIPEGTGTSPGRLEPESLPREAHILHADYDLASATIELETPEPFRARYLAFYYPGWRVTVDGTPVAIIPTKSQGLIAFDVPAGQHTVHVRFGETPLRLAADVISILSLAALIVATIRLWLPISSSTQFTGPPSERRRAIAHLAVAGILLAVKLIILDRTDTPLRRADLANGHLHHPDILAHVTFGDEFVLLGYDALPQGVASGERFEVITYWRALQAGGPRYGVTVNVVDEDQGHRWNGSDIRSPRWHRTPPPTGEWPPDQYALIALSVPLLPGTPPGTYTVEIVAFDHSTLTPLTAHEADGLPLGPELPIGKITVAAPEQSPSVGKLDIDHPLQTSLGPLTLLSADFDRGEAAPGDLVLLTTFWQAERQPDQDHSFQLTLTASASEGISAADYSFPPTVSWHPTSAWRPGDIWRGQHAFRLPATLEDGTYTCRLSLSSTSQSTILPSTIHVTAPPHVFTAPPVEIALGARLSDVATLVGATVEPTTLKPGIPLTATLVWQVESTPARSYRVFLHLIGPEGHLVAQSDGIPARWSRPTTGWIPDEYITDAHALVPPADLPPGDYTLLVGMYASSGERLTTLDGADAVRITTLSK